MGRKNNVTPPEFKQIVGAQIKALRKEHNLKQSEFAEKLGLDHSAISNYERGVFDISLYSFFKLCYALNKKPITILRRIETVLMKMGFWKKKSTE